MTSKHSDESHQMNIINTLIDYLKIGEMQKELNIATNKKIVFLFLFSFVCLQSFSQKKESIKSTVDYLILNKSIDRFFFSKHKKDSIDLADLVLIEGKIPNNIEIKKSIKRAKKEIKNDTIDIKAIAKKLDGEKK